MREKVASSGVSRAITISPHFDIILHQALLNKFPPLGFKTHLGSHLSNHQEIITLPPATDVLPEPEDEPDFCQGIEDNDNEQGFEGGEDDNHQGFDGDQGDGDDDDASDLSQIDLPLPAPYILQRYNLVSGLVEVATKHFQDPNTRQFISTYLRSNIRCACQPMTATAMSGQPLSVFASMYHQHSHLAALLIPHSPWVSD